MNDKTLPSLPSPDNRFEPESGEKAHTAPRASRFGFLSGLAVGALAMATLTALGGAHLGLAEAALRGMGRSGHPVSVEEARDHAEFFTSFLLHRLGASEDQTTRVLAIVDATVDQAHPLIEEHRDAREQFASLLAKPTVDRAGIEKLRVDEIALVDRLSKTLAASIADAADVLTPEQRLDLVEKMHRFPH